MQIPNRVILVSLLVRFLRHRLRRVHANPQQAQPARPARQGHRRSNQGLNLPTATRRHPRRPVADLGFGQPFAADDNPAFKSFPEASGTDPSWDQQGKKVANQGFTLKADKSGSDLYLLYTTDKLGDKAATKTEGYSINGGLGGKDGTGKEYVLEAGKLTESLGAISMTWVFFPLKVVLPLAIAAMGSSAQGTESLDGRQADKFGVDTANAPAGTMGALGSFLSVTSAKGTVWIDKETGALLKCNLDYTQDLVDPPGSQTVVGKGNGHIELNVTKVNNTTVTLPK